LLWLWLRWGWSFGAEAFMIPPFALLVPVPGARSMLAVVWAGFVVQSVLR